MTTKTKGLLVFIQGQDCTAGGVTSGRKMAVLIGDGIPEVCEATDENPALWLEYDLQPKGAKAGQLSVAKPSWLAQLGVRKAVSGNPYECLTDDWASKHQIVNVVARPINGDGTARTGGMAGGNYISTSDSRFPITGPMPVHDRFES